MKRISFVLGTIFMIVTMSSCVENYSNGERIGFVTKFSKKGVCWDSWEGELNLTQTGMNTSSLFDFSVDNDVNDANVIAMIDSAAMQGWKVKLTYHEVWGVCKNFLQNRGETNDFVTNVMILDRTSIGSNENNFMKQSVATKDNITIKTIHDTIYLVIYKDAPKNR